MRQWKRNVEKPIRANCVIFLIPLSSIFIFVTISVSKDRQNTLNCIHVHVDIRRNICSDCDLIVAISRPKGRQIERKKLSAVSWHFSDGFSWNRNGERDDSNVPCTFRDTIYRILTGSRGQQFSISSIRVALRANPRSLSLSLGKSPKKPLRKIADFVAIAAAIRTRFLLYKYYILCGHSIYIYKRRRVIFLVNTIANKILRTRPAYTLWPDDDNSLDACERSPIASSTRDLLYSALSRRARSRTKASSRIVKPRSRERCFSTINLNSIAPLCLFLLWEINAKF